MYFLSNKHVFDLYENEVATNSVNDLFFGVVMNCIIFLYNNDCMSLHVWPLRW